MGRTDLPKKVGFAKVRRRERFAKGSWFCYGEKEMERFYKIFNYYVGNHNFHNFTTRKRVEDPSAQCFIISFDANTTLVVEGMV